MNAKQLKKLCIVLAVIAGLLLVAVCWIAISNAVGDSQTEKQTESLRAENEHLQNRLLEIENEFAEEYGKYESLQEDYSDSTEEVERLEKASAEMEADIEALKAENESLKNDYKLYKNVISQDEVENTLFGQPISKERDGEYRIGVKTATDGDFHAELSIYQAKDGKYEKVFSCEALVGKNGPGKQSEGDVKTPLGTWTIGEAYGIKEDPGCKVPFTQITDDMYWCATGSNGLNYNHLLYRSEHPDWDYSEDEHLIDYPIRYAYLLDLGYNAACAPYAGNAIFLHCWKEPDYPTGGCVAVSEEDMVTILQTITPGTSVTIY